MDLFITTQDWGGYKVFDIISYFTVILLIGKPKNLISLRTFYTAVSLLLMVVLIIGGLHSEFIARSFVFLSQFITVFIYASILVRQLHQEPTFIYDVLKGLKFSCLFSLAFLAMQLIFGLSVALYKLNLNASAYDSIIRYPSYFEDPQKYGQFLAMSSFIFLIENPAKKINSLINPALFFLVIVALFLTGVRAAFTGLCVGMIIIFIFGDKKYKLLGIACTAVVIITAVFFSNHFAIFNRGADVNDTASVRYAYWAGAFKIFLQNPFLGIGIGNYQSYVSLHSQDQFWLFFGTYEYMDHPESGYLKLLVEFGVLGFILLLFLIFLPIINAFRVIINPVFANEKKLLLFVSASLICWLVAFVTVYSFSDLRIGIFVVTLVSILISPPHISPFYTSDEI
ncbi:O-antigen ligase family protein [Pedobacter punctiformis]|uniref:O-antigen ligase family protein n=1 Tax=Pedobacter punctiformis TaxID=3004097 RepID=A0ABT4L8A5_9SPHI|nr:O-antigen ligase family protein [Pedobacter sp. HCMS5-2]MCZ4244145.1 O-antigen ligase family protein [Pedobacter sp. HCMS5-2]